MLPKLIVHLQYLRIKNIYKLVFVDYRRTSFMDGRRTYTILTS